jgi:hypothetical protein
MTLQEDLVRAGHTHYRDSRGEVDGVLCAISFCMCLLQVAQEVFNQVWMSKRCNIEGLTDKTEDRQILSVNRIGHSEK